MEVAGTRAALDWIVDTLYTNKQTDYLASQLQHHNEPYFRSDSTGASKEWLITALSDVCSITLRGILNFRRPRNVVSRGNLREAIQEEQDRFRLWATNIGAFEQAASQKSLDCRLAKSPLIRKGVVQALTKLLMLERTSTYSAREHKMPPTNSTRTFSPRHYKPRVPEPGGGDCWSQRPASEKRARSTVA